MCSISMTRKQNAKEASKPPRDAERASAPKKNNVHHSLGLGHLKRRKLQRRKGFFFFVVLTTPSFSPSPRTEKFEKPKQPLLPLRPLSAATTTTTTTTTATTVRQYRRTRISSSSNDSGPNNETSAANVVAANPLFANNPAFAAVLADSLNRQGSDALVSGEARSPEDDSEKEGAIEEVLASCLRDQRQAVVQLEQLEKAVKAALERERKQFERLQFAFKKAANDRAYAQSLAKLRKR